MAAAVTKERQLPMTGGKLPKAAGGLINKAHEDPLIVSEKEQKNV